MIFVLHWFIYFVTVISHQLEGAMHAMGTEKDAVVKDITAFNEVTLDSPPVPQLQSRR